MKCEKVINDTIIDFLTNSFFNMCIVLKQASTYIVNLEGKKRQKALLFVMIG